MICFIKKITIPITLLLISCIIFILVITDQFSIGLLINNYFPCEQEPMNSFPCYGIYDIYTLLTTSVVALFSLFLIIFKLIKSTKNGKNN